MFTGLVEDKGDIIEIGRKGSSFQIRIKSRLDFTRSDVGASIAVDGVCLTIVIVNGNVFTVDVSPETLQITTIGERKRGDSVNLERALRLSDRVGGHLVTGHIDGIGVIKTIAKMQNSILISIATSPETVRYLVKKGSVGLDGVSLTINDIRDTTFSVAIIPHTAAITTIGKKKTGDRINIEGDIIGKYIEKFVQQTELTPKKEEGGASIDYDFLNKHGFS
ncbi:MAG: riboflavin synthase, partial [Proteobacteria bacterium]|nr:riboflavin synthase [Pseudomonadota bacterium]